MGAMASQITSLTIVYSTVYSSTDQRKHQSSASLAFVRGIHRWPVNSPHKWPITRMVLPFDDVIMFRVIHRRKRWIPVKRAGNEESVVMAWRLHIECDSYFVFSTSLKLNWINRVFYCDIPIDRKQSAEIVEIGQLAQPFSMASLNGRELSICI